ncbi:MAG TPA: hypothetical protein VHK01_07470 [Lacipirellulaceae bacterium]|jgi:hypothetical protein|nr:hypothetical protein [Lacipirellulaceae bacterium]
MVKQPIASILFVIGLVTSGLANYAMGSEMLFGCWDRPACGKCCKLVCETTKITVVGYGSKCDTICIPGPSCKGCKHCDCTCCPSDACGPCGTNDGDVCCGPCCKGCCCEAAPAKIEFCWRDWVANGCAKPRTIKLLTKYQAEKEISWYHWEVVDAADCCDAVESGDETAAIDGSASAASRLAQIYKPAPADAQPGDVLPLSDGERAQLTSFLNDTAGTTTLPATGKVSVDASQDQAQAPEQQTESPSLLQKFNNLLKR